MLLLIVLRVLAFIGGASIVIGILLTAVRQFVLPRSAPDQFTKVIFLTVRALFNLRLRSTNDYLERDRVLALYAPISLLTLPATWLACVLMGYMGMFWALGVPSWTDAFRASGSGLFTLGFAPIDSVPATIFTFTEAGIGLFLVALLIAYLPTMYAAFSRREAAVTMLEVRAGSPPSAIEMLKRFTRLNRLEKLGELWVAWEAWFVDIEESHTSLAALSFFRSPQPHRSWVVAAGAVLDAAALVSSTIDVPKDTQVDLCLRAGYLSLRHIANFFRITHNPNPTPADPISIAREEFDAAYDELASAGVPLKPDREQAWRDFVGWRVNYDTVLLALAGLTMAPKAPWSSDRAPLLRGVFGASQLPQSQRAQRGVHSGTLEEG